MKVGIEYMLGTLANSEAKTNHYRSSSEHFSTAFHLVTLNEGLFCNLNLPRKVPGWWEDNQGLNAAGGL